MDQGERERNAASNRSILIRPLSRNCTDTVRCFFCLPRTPLPQWSFPLPICAFALLPEHRRHQYNQKAPPTVNQKPFSTMTSSRGPKLQYEPLTRSLLLPRLFVSQQL
ncbi:hypothetical protein CPAR01_04438 [Colletotrichum paranaense]|uniref:Uncharacterized protein n=1 Tax=Colletotrichum paranaense TaxID=1914294 RepID=A0ABQ9SWB4_9PEZI|nr:uncharacterized protein CPAR01_04438 [Colletotrichum paranaense]KAK1543805.1 hypothetical protein CPAR01_04438 [Colletotrichum paranaense]